MSKSPWASVTYPLTLSPLSVSPYNNSSTEASISSFFLSNTNVFGLYNTPVFHPKSTNIWAPGRKKYRWYILSKSWKLWTVKPTVVFLITPNVPSVVDEKLVIPAGGFRYWLSFVPNSGGITSSFFKPCINSVSPLCPSDVPTDSLGLVEPWFKTWLPITYIRFEIGSFFIFSLDSCATSSSVPSVVLLNISTPTHILTKGVLDDSSAWLSNSLSINSE